LRDTTSPAAEFPPLAKLAIIELAQRLSAVRFADKSRPGAASVLRNASTRPRSVGDNP
jgi:hypothetical protein